MRPEVNCCGCYHENSINLETRVSQLTLVLNKEQQQTCLFAGGEDWLEVLKSRNNSTVVNLLTNAENTEKISVKSSTVLVAFMVLLSVMIRKKNF